MICQPCVEEAEGATYINPDDTKCLTCGRTVKVNKSGRLRTHYGNWGRQYGPCHGSMNYLVGGHLACEGCPCQHKPKGSWNG